MGNGALLGDGFGHDGGIEPDPLRDMVVVMRGEDAAVGEEAGEAKGGGGAV